MDYLNVNDGIFYKNKVYVYLQQHEKITKAPSMNEGCHDLNYFWSGGVYITFTIYNLLNYSRPFRMSYLFPSHNYMSQTSPGDLQSEQGDQSNAVHGYKWVINDFYKIASLITN